MVRVESLLAIARKGPYLRGSQEWYDRELARMALGCKCLSFDPIQDRTKDQGFAKRVNPLKFNH